MQSTIECTCGKHLDTGAQMPGDRAQCPVCGNVFVFGEPVKTTSIQAVPLHTSFTLATPPSEPPHGQYARSWVVTLLLEFAAVICFWTVLAAGVYLGLPLMMTICDHLLRGREDDRDLARTQVKGPLTNACQAFRLKNARWPKDLKELHIRDDKGGPYVENPDALIDPWGSMYQYDAMGPMNNGARPDIWTVFPKTGAKIGNWPTR